MSVISLWFNIWHFFNQVIWNVLTWFYKFSINWCSASRAKISCIKTIWYRSYQRISFLVILTWELFVEWLYFDLTTLEVFYNSFNEFTYWLNLLKYNLELITSQICHSKMYIGTGSIRLTPINNWFKSVKIIKMKLFNWNYLAIKKNNYISVCASFFYTYIENFIYNFYVLV